MKNIHAILVCFYFRDRMNLKVPIYFSTGLTEKVWELPIVLTKGSCS